MGRSVLTEFYAFLTATEHGEQGSEPHGCGGLGFEGWEAGQRHPPDLSATRKFPRKAPAASKSEAGVGAIVQWVG